MVGRALLAVAPVILGDLETLEFDLLARLEAPQLLLLADLQPELDHNRPVPLQLVLEVVDFGVATQPVRLGAIALDALDEHAAIPGAIENRHPANARNVPPKPPHIGLGTLLFGRRGNGDDLILARIHRCRDAPDAAALARGIRAFKGNDQRMLLEFGMADQFRQTPLPFGELFCVGLVFQLLRQIERGQNVQRVNFRGQRRRHREILVARVRQALLQRIEDHLAHRQRAIAIIGAFNHDPRRPRRVGHAQYVAGGFLQLVVGLQAIPARRGHPPRRQRVVLHRLQALALPILREMKPELEDQGPLIDQHRLEAIDLIHALIKIPLGKRTEDAIADRVGIPRSGKHAGPPLGRQGAPVTPHVGAFTLFVTGRRERERRQIARIHPFVQHVDRFPLAGAIDATDQNDHRKFAVLAQVELRIEQGGP